MSEQVNQGAEASDENVVSKSEFARLNGWSKAYVTKLKDEGRLVLTDDGKQVKVAESLALIQETTRAHERASPPAVPTAIQSLEEEGRRLDNRRKKLELAKSLELVVDVADVNARVAEAGTLLRRRLEAWPHRLAPQLAALGANEARIRAFLINHVELELGEFSTQLSRRATSR